MSRQFEVTYESDSQIKNIFPDVNGEVKYSYYPWTSNTLISSRLYDDQKSINLPETHWHNFDTLSKTLEFFPTKMLASKLLTLKERDVDDHDAILRFVSKNPFSAESIQHYTTKAKLEDNPTTNIIDPLCANILESKNAQNALLKLRECDDMEFDHRIKSIIVQKHLYSYVGKSFKFKCRISYLNPINKHSPAVTFDNGFLYVANYGTKDVILLMPGNSLYILKPNESCLFCTTGQEASLFVPDSPVLLGVTTFEYLSSAKFTSWDY